MDNAVALVRTYLQLNGYFTITECPVMETASGEHFRSVTDIDVLALRFPGAGEVVLRHRGKASQVERATEAVAKLPVSVDEYKKRAADYEERAVLFREQSR